MALEKMLGIGSISTKVKGGISYGLHSVDYGLSGFKSSVGTYVKSLGFAAALSLVGCGSSYNTTPNENTLESITASENVQLNSSMCKTDKTAKTGCTQGLILIRCTRSDGAAETFFFGIGSGGFCRKNGCNCTP